MRRTKRDRYHHGDLRVALIDAAVELIAEHGVQAFSLAEASRRLGVAASAPYRHFADRNELLVAAGVRACEVLVATVAAESVAIDGPSGQLAAAARGYVRFAAENRALFEIIFGTALDRSSHPELERAAEPVKSAFQTAARALCDGDPFAADRLAVAVAATAHGHADLLAGDAFGADGLTEAIERTEAATLALVAGRDALRAPR